MFSGEVIKVDEVEHCNVTRSSSRSLLFWSYLSGLIIAHHTTQAFSSASNELCEYAGTCWPELSKRIKIIIYDDNKVVYTASVHAMSRHPDGAKTSFVIYTILLLCKYAYAMIFFTTWRSFNSYALCSICYYASFLIFVVHSSLHTAYSNTEQRFTRINSAEVIEKSSKLKPS